MEWNECIPDWIASLRRSEQAKKLDLDGEKDEMKEMRKDILSRIEKMKDEAEKKPEDKKFKTDTQEELLGRVRYFLEKTEEGLKKSKIETFLVGYKRLCLFADRYRQVDNLFGTALEVNVMKGFGIDPQGTDRLSQVIFIDAVAHNLHKEKIYPILDELANLSKSFGETERNDRMMILSTPDVKDSLKDLNNITILRKGQQLEDSPNLWELFEKAIRNGIQMLTDQELVLLREWMYARI